jgi:integrase
MSGPPARVGLAAALDGYLAQRRALGYRLAEEERHCRVFLGWLQATTGQGDAFTAGQATAWARGNTGLKNSYQCQRLSAVRGFARHCAALGMDVQVAPATALRGAKSRRAPHVYSQAELDSLVRACPLVFAHRLVQATMSTLIGLLAVTGMRVGEALRLDAADIDFGEAAVLVRANKHGPDRAIPLDATTCAALAGYVNNPFRLAAAPAAGRVLVTTKGLAYQRASIDSYFARLRETALPAWEGTPPTLHDLRHTFATRQMIRAYTTDGADPAATISLLAIWLGHSHPSHTYWYVQAVPELLALAARRLDPPTHKE